MSKKIMLAVLLVAFTTMPAFASVQNIKVSGGIDSFWINRANFDLGSNAAGKEEQNFFATQTKLRVDADLTDNVSTTVQIINERAWDNPADNSTNSGIDLNLAYVTLREMLYSPLTVVVGRQNFAYGNSFIVDSAGTNNSAPADSGWVNAAGDLTGQTAQDAVRLIFDYKPLKLEFLASKVDSNTITATTLNNRSDDIDLFGANASYELGDSMNTMVESYFFAKLDHSVKGRAAGGARPSVTDSTLVPGLHVSTNPIEGLNVQGEVAWQGGTKITNSTNSLGTQKREAIAAQFIANYQLPVAKEYKPVAQYVYTYVSGDHNPEITSTSGNPNDKSGEKWTAWDPMFENQAGGKIYNAIFNLTNAHISTVSLQANPIQDVTTKLSWTSLWLDKELSTAGAAAGLSLVNPDGTARTASVNPGETYLGSELDLQSTYAYTEDVSFGANVGWFWPGDDLFAVASQSTAFQSVVDVNVNF